MKYFFFHTLIFFSVFSFCQNESGKLIYKSEVKKFSIQIDSTNISREQYLFMKNIMKKQGEKDYEMIFQNGVSNYYEYEKNEIVDKDIENVIGNMKFGLLYKNLTNNNYLKEKEFLGKQFLIEDNLPDFNWKILEETKNIESFICLKAIGEITDDDKKIEVVAWFAKDIHVSNGPLLYNGLPGLILEIDTESVNLKCNKISIEHKVEITIPKRGKKVTQNEYDKLVKQKMIEMKQQYGDKMPIKF